VPIYEFDSVLTVVCGEISMENKLICDALPQCYKYMDLARRAPSKLYVLLSSMISEKRELYDVGGELANNTATDLQAYFSCVVLEQIDICPPMMSVIEGRRKRMKMRIDRVTEQQSFT